MSAWQALSVSASSLSSCCQLIGNKDSFLPQSIVLDANWVPPEGTVESGEPNSLGLPPDMAAGDIVYMTSCVIGIVCVAKL